MHFVPSVFVYTMNMFLYWVHFSVSLFTRMSFDSASMFAATLMTRVIDM